MAFDLSQEAMAVEVGSSPRHISRLENGRVLPSREMVAAIVDALGLGERDRLHLLAGAGHAVEVNPADVSSASLRWLRRSAALMLQALDPYPSMLTNGVTEIVLVNRSWMGLFGERIDPSAGDAVADYYGELLAALAHDEALGIDSQCGLLLTLMQEAVIRDDDELAALVTGLAQAHAVPGDWIRRASSFDPIASFGVVLEVDGRSERFFHLSQGIHPQGPSAYMGGGGLAVLTLLPDDHGRDWSSLAARGADHGLLAERALRRS